MNDADETDPAPFGDADGYYPLRVAEVRRETADAVSLVFAIPASLRATFAYRAGQYVTLRVAIDRKPLDRCYSMSSAPEMDAALRVTIKRIADGRVSAWAQSVARAGDVVRVMPPAGRFCLRREEGALVLLGAGSGITPLVSLAKAALAGTARPVVVLQADRDRASAILGDELDALADAYPGRLRLSRWFDAARGLIDAPALTALGIVEADADVFVCGPDAFMAVAEAAALAAGVDRERLFVERFVSPPNDAGAAVMPVPDAGGTACETLTVVLTGRTTIVPYVAGESIVQAARRAGLRPPVSCLQGACATCMARVTQGSVAMHCNDVLTPGEVADGYVLTCQGLPTARAVTIVYED